jgi:hypothetical protein
MCESRIVEQITRVERELNDVKAKRAELDIRESQLTQKLQQLKIQQLQEANESPVANFAGIKCSKCGCNLPMDEDAIAAHGAVCKVRLRGGGHKIPIGLEGYGSGPVEEKKPAMKLGNMTLSPSTKLTGSSYFGELRNKDTYSPQTPAKQVDLDGLRQAHVDDAAAYTWDSGQVNTYQCLPQVDQSKRENRKEEQLEAEQQKLKEQRIVKQLQKNIQLEHDLPLPPPKPPKSRPAACAPPPMRRSSKAGDSVKTSATTVSSEAAKAAQAAQAADDIL